MVCPLFPQTKMLFHEKNSLASSQFIHMHSLPQGSHQTVLCRGSAEVQISTDQFSSVQSLSCVQLCDPMNCSTPGLPVHHQLPEFTQTHVNWLVMTSNHLILCHPLLLLPSIFPSIRVFSNESVLPLRWPKNLSFSFNISPSNE